MTLSGTTVTVGESAMSGKVKVPITLTWTDLSKNTTNVDANTADTDTGVNKSALKVPVTLNVTQHL